eukprot:GFKZ01000081.1.p1 GENE.GFKZ01000081.1~~GFKZ01000081.1.p1  ORF type:complete len:200 (-),score=6.21 GFKZ01000081.1:483-1082(-)
MEAGIKANLHKSPTEQRALDRVIDDPLFARIAHGIGVTTVSRHSAPYRNLAYRNSSALPLAETPKRRNATMTRFPVKPKTVASSLSPTTSFGRLLHPMFRPSTTSVISQPAAGASISPPYFEPFGHVSQYLSCWTAQSKSIGRESAIFQPSLSRCRMCLIARSSPTMHFQLKVPTSLCSHHSTHSAGNSICGYIRSSGR